MTLFLEHFKRGFEDGNGEAPAKVTLNDLYIRNKDRQVVALVPNETQAALLDMWTQDYPPFDWRRGNYTLRGMREDILKFRQPGISTIVLALYFLDTVNNPNTHTVIIAHTPSTSALLFEIMRRYWENLPAEKKPVCRYLNRSGSLGAEMSFATLGSSIYVGKVAAKGWGRGGTVSNVHMSERAWWGDGGDDTEAGLIESVPPSGNITRETTANGMNAFYSQYKAAQRGERPYRARFFAWNLHKEYTLEPPRDFQMTPEEEELARAFNLTPGQIYWRREKIGALEALGVSFSQEYPLTPEEAFVANTQRSVFPLPYLQTLLGEVSKPENAPIRVIRAGEYGVGGEVRVYKDEEPGREYLVTIDPSEGITKDEDHDYTAIDVWDIERWEQVCHYHGRPDPALAARDAVWIARNYNDALIMPERNNHGHAVIVGIKDVENYYHIYQHQDYDDLANPSEGEGRWGFPATTKTKTLSIDDLVATIYDRSRHHEGLIIRDPQTIEEMMTYVKYPGGRTAADRGAHDDCVTSAAMAAYYLKRRGVIEKMNDRFDAPSETPRYRTRWSLQ